MGEISGSVKEELMVQVIYMTVLIYEEGTRKISMVVLGSDDEPKKYTVLPKLQEVPISTIHIFWINVLFVLDVLVS
jgi:hypothetical protein